MAALRVNHQAAVDKQVGYRNAGTQDAAGVIAQVNHQALQLGLRHQLIQGSGGFIAGGSAELGDAQIAIAGCQKPRADARHLDGIPYHGDLKGFRFTRPANFQIDGRTHGTPHNFDRLVDGHAFYRLAIKFQDHVPGLQAGLHRR